jgi:ubiquinone/menaquinone biosynthesis C-methylase UbiE
MLETGVISYDSVAWFYEPLAHVYSGGQIYAMKVSQISEIQPGDKVLYVGVGGGEDAILAAKSNANVTVIDVAPRMLERAARKFRAAHLEDSVEIICSDVFKHERVGYYDVVVVNFLLSAFPQQTMKDMLSHLSKLTRKGGKLLIGDFSYPFSGGIMGLIQWVYNVFGIFNIWLIGLADLHPMYNYEEFFDAVNLGTIKVDRFRVCPFFPAHVESITASKV